MVWIVALIASTTCYSELVEEFLDDLVKNAMVRKMERIAFYDKLLCIIRMRENGVTDREIGVHFNVSTQNIWQLRKQYGIDIPLYRRIPTSK